MTKSELALELTKLVSEKIIALNRYGENSANPEKDLTAAYNYILENIKCTEP